MDTKERLARAALSLRAAAPTAYDEFCRALDQLRMDHDDACIEAPPEHTSRFQGRALGTRHLLKELLNAPTTVAKIEANQKAKP